MYGCKYTYIPQNSRLIPSLSRKRLVEKTFFLSLLCLSPALRMFRLFTHTVYHLSCSFAGSSSFLRVFVRRRVQSRIAENTGKTQSGRCRNVGRTDGRCVSSAFLFRVPASIATLDIWIVRECKFGHVQGCLFALTRWSATRRIFLTTKDGLAV